MDRTLTEKEAAEYLGIPANTLKKMRCLGPQFGQADPPPYLRYGPRTVRYSLRDLEDYRAAHRVDPQAVGA